MATGSPLASSCSRASASWASSQPGKVPASDSASVSSASGGTARQLAGVAGERECGQVDGFADGEVRVPAVGEVVDRPLCLDGVDAGEDGVAGAFGEQVHAQDAAAVALGDELDQ